MKIFLVVGLVVVLLIMAQQIVSNRFLGRIEHLQQQLVLEQQADVGQVGDLPQIVRTFAIRAGAREGEANLVRLTQSASIRFSPDQAWQDLAATHVAGTRVSGFVWHARGSMKGLSIGVVDSFVEGNGLLNARILNTVSVANSEGTATDRGELLRYLAEIPMTPDVILNNSSLVWEQIDDNRVLVSTMLNGENVSVEFTFNEEGDIAEAFAAARPMGVGDTWVDTPWRGRFFDYQQLGLRRIPIQAEVGWELPEGYYVYFRGSILSYALE